jgi:hypothetical protein
MSQMTRRLELLDRRLVEKRSRMERQMLLVQVQQMLLLQLRASRMESAKGTRQAAGLWRSSSVSVHSSRLVSDVLGD